MITFTCRNITNGTACTGRVRYAHAPVEMVAMCAQLKDNVDAAVKAAGNNAATHDQFKAAVRQTVTNAAANQQSVRTKIIYLTCDAEDMHVESYEVPVNK